jgi:hypothetical protein
MVGMFVEMIVFIDIVVETYDTVYVVVPSLLIGTSVSVCVPMKLVETSVDNDVTVIPLVMIIVDVNTSVLVGKLIGTCVCESV